MAWKYEPKRVVKLSAASRNSVVGMALSFSFMMGTSVNERDSVLKKVSPGGYVVVDILERLL